MWQGRWPRGTNAATGFIPGRGLQLDTGTSYVKYLLPQTISGGEFSMDVEGLRANAPGDKAKVFGMQEGQSDFITNYLLNPSATYHWKFTWASDIRLIVRDGGISGSTLYDFGMPALRGSYTPSPHDVYLGAPVGRNGTESASIAGTIYRNVWMGNRPRPDSLGSGLTDR